MRSPPASLRTSCRGTAPFRSRAFSDRKRRVAPVWPLVIKVVFDVDDAALRDTFLRTFFFGALDTLRPEHAARWGHLTAQQMVEHLVWTFEVSTGRVTLECPYPADQRDRMKS